MLTKMSLRLKVTFEYTYVRRINGNNMRKNVDTYCRCCCRHCRVLENAFELYIKSYCLLSTTPQTPHSKVSAPAYTKLEQSRAEVLKEIIERMGVLNYG